MSLIRLHHLWHGLEGWITELGESPEGLWEHRCNQSTIRGKCHIDSGTHFIPNLLHLTHVAFHLQWMKGLSRLGFYYQYNMPASIIFFLYQILFLVKNIWSCRACVYKLTYICWRKECNRFFCIVLKEHPNLHNVGLSLMCLTLHLPFIITEHQCAYIQNGDDNAWLRGFE